jgi:hypothetical protein
MQKELELDYSLQIIGINEVGFDASNDIITDGRDIGWLQDTVEVNAWDLWDVEYRDVYILDQEHKLQVIYNLTKNDLTAPDTYEDLKEIFIQLLEE